MFLNSTVLSSIFLQFISNCETQFLRRMAHTPKTPSHLPASWISLMNYLVIFHEVKSGTWKWGPDTAIPRLLESHMHQTTTQNTQASVGFFPNDSEWLSVVQWARFLFLTMPFPMKYLNVYISWIRKHRVPVVLNLIKYPKRVALLLDKSKGLPVGEAQRPISPQKTLPPVASPRHSATDTQGQVVTTESRRSLGTGLSLAL